MDFRFSVVVYLLILVLANSFDVVDSSDSFYVSRNTSLVSPGGVFELGFFSFGDRWYFGIWYKKIPKRTYVWVGNRDIPLYNSNATLEISGANIVLLDSNHRIIWDTGRGNEISPELVAELLANGNLVLRNKDPGDYLWQSFDNPTDTLLPDMKLRSSKVPNFGSRRYLASWKAPNDPAKGNFIFGMDGDKFPRILIMQGEEITKVYRSGGWNGIEFADLPLVFNSTNEDGESTFVYQDNDLYSIVTLTPDGVLNWLTWNQRSQEWTLRWTALLTYCDRYNHCGANSYCNAHTSPPTCNCITGFEPGTSRNVTGGCVRKTPVSCNCNRFSQLTKMKLPDTVDAKQYSPYELKTCRDMCVKDCHCTAYTVIVYQNGTSSSNCVTWSGDLLDLQNYAMAGQDLYIRLNGKTKNKSRLIIGLSLGATAAVIIIVILLVLCIWRRKQNQARATAMDEMQSNEDTFGAEETETLAMDIIQSNEDIFGAEETETLQLPPMDFGLILRATENFSDANEIGHGGFGTVYKGRLPSGQEIAVKRLSEVSRQGTVEFKTEVMLIANLQHINLVKLLGWSVHERERVLIYEYLENGSLQHHLFGGGQNSSDLNWQMRFEIIKGICHGLAYMQDGSRVMIVHRDLKPANILLDRNMIPKISDFGLARICSRSESKAVTTKPSGTYGYMSPEYAESGLYSAKSDIFSFGVMLLEIVSGKENRSFSYSLCRTNLLSYIWTKWNDGNWEETIEQAIQESSSFQKHQVRRCLEVGLLCVQQDAEDRPQMLSVVMMLLNEATDIPRPKLPGFYKAENYKDQSEIYSTSGSQW
ncbi:unnamed protein product [Arabidopsis lyrata]|nr:unnamed protein product [Arabidopsis lyrata]